MSERIPKRKKGAGDAHPSFWRLRTSASLVPRLRNAGFCTWRFSVVTEASSGRKSFRGVCACHVSQHGVAAHESFHLNVMKGGSMALMRNLAR
jgi:hypothetical protein